MRNRIIIGLTFVCLLALTLSSCIMMPVPGYPSYNSGDESGTPETDDGNDTTLESVIEPSEYRTNPDTETSGGEETGTGNSGAIPEEVTVRPAEWVNVNWTTYRCAYFTLSVPYGWNVQWNGNSKQLYWEAVSSDGSTGVYNLDHRNAAKDYNFYQAGYADMYLKDGTVQEYFETIYKNEAEYFTVKESVVPSNKAAIQASAPNKQIRDYQALYAVFRQNGFDGEGIYSAITVNTRDYVIRGMNYGTWEIDAIFGQFAKLGDLVNWAPVLTQIAASFRYTDYYYSEWMSNFGTSNTPANTGADSDPVLEAFEERSKSDTIIQEKRSDMIGEYERVYDTDSGEIYRAYNGFLDDIGTDQTKYIPITDSQYTEGYKGWIDKWY